MDDKRKFPRLGEIWDMNFRTITAEEFKKNPISSFTMNISGGGICFEVDKEIPTGTMLACELKSTVFPSPIIVLAKTIWCKKEKKKDIFDVGAEFWWTGWKDNDAQEAVSDYIVKEFLGWAKKKRDLKSKKNK